MDQVLLRRFYISSYKLTNLDIASLHASTIGRKPSRIAIRGQQCHSSVISVIIAGYGCLTLHISIYYSSNSFTIEKMAGIWTQTMQRRPSRLVAATVITYQDR